jgi:hypothetical protein
VPPTSREAAVFKRRARGCAAIKRRTTRIRPGHYQTPIRPIPDPDQTPTRPRPEPTRPLQTLKNTTLRIFLESTWNRPRIDPSATPRGAAVYTSSRSPEATPQEGPQVSRGGRLRRNLQEAAGNHKPTRPLPDPIHDPSSRGSPFRIPQGTPQGNPWGFPMGDPLSDPLVEHLGGSPRGSRASPEQTLRHTPRGAAVFTKSRSRREAAGIPNPRMQ